MIGARNVVLVSMIAVLGSGIEDFAAAAQQAGLRVGAAAVNLEADDSMVIAGNIVPGRAKGQEGELRAVAVVIEKPGSGKVAIVACDVLFVTAEDVDPVVARIEQTTGIPASHVLVNATHTHHAPSTAVVHGYGRDEVFSQRLREGIVEAVQQANAKLGGGESDFLFHLGEERTVGINSRIRLADGRIFWIGPRPDEIGPTGPLDVQLPVLAFRGPGDRLRALIYNHSTHPIGTIQSGVRSPSFYGLAAQQLEAQLGCVVSFLEGASGSTHNLMRIAPDEATRRFKDAVTDALGKAKPRSVDRVAAIKRRFTFKVRHFDEAVEDQKVISYCRKRVPHVAESYAKVFRDMRKKLAPQQGEQRRSWIQAMVIGDVAIVGVPAEYFTSLGMDIKRRSPFKHTVVAGLANDTIGYLPDREGHKLGGYQTWMGLHSFAEEGTGERMAEEVLAMLQELADAKVTGNPAVPPRSPAESLKALHLAEGFEAELVVAEPMVMDPVAIAWGPDTRLWVVEMADYPLGMDGQMKAGGRLRYLEDTDGDGAYDRSTLFLEGLNFPNGVLPWRKGVLVTAAPDLIYAEDTNGDGKADHREILYTGFTEGNPQLRINGLRYGLDNWVYCANGLSTKGTVKSAKTGKTIEVSGRDFRIRPDTGELDAQAGPSQYGRNPDNWGNWFGVDNSHPLWHYILADHYTRRNPHVSLPQSHKQLVDLSPVFPRSRLFEHYEHPVRGKLAASTCAALIYRDELLFGPGGKRQAFTCEPFHNLVLHYELTDAGVSFDGRLAEKSKLHFLASADNWTRPVLTRTGPDGALWVVDMYRYLIEHPEYFPKHVRPQLQPFYRYGDDRGRIYRIHPTGRKPRPYSRLDRMDTPQLVAMLDSPSSWHRDMAQQMLIWAADPAAVEPLAKLACECSNPLARVHALCTLDGLGALTPALLMRALADPHPGVRRHAVRLSESMVDEEAILPTLLKLADDPDPKVRLQLASTLGVHKDPRAGRALGRIAVSDRDEPYIIAAVLSSALPHHDWLVDKVLVAGAAPNHVLLGRLLDLSLALKRMDTTVRLLEPVLASPDGSYELWQLEAFAGWMDTLSRRKSSMAKIAEGKEDAILAGAAQLTGAARDIALDGEEAIDRRVAAMRVLGRLQPAPPPDIEALAGLLVVQTDVRIQIAAIRALGRSGDQRVPGLLMQNWESHLPPVRLAMVDVLLGREAWAKALLDSIAKQQLAPSDLDAARRQRLLKHGSESVRKQAEQLLRRNVNPDRQKAIESYRSALEMKGDWSRGADVFARLCATCHRIDEVGIEIGPNLRSLTDQSPEGRLVSILDPNRAKEPRFTAYIAELSDYEEIYGILIEESGASVTFKLQDGATRTVLRQDIALLRSTRLSLMPDGLEQNMTLQEMADLLRYLAGRE